MIRQKDRLDLEPGSAPHWGGDGKLPWERSHGGRWGTEDPNEPLFLSHQLQTTVVSWYLPPQESTLNSRLTREVCSPVKPGVANIRLEKEIFSREKRDFQSSPNSSPHVTRAKLG